MKIYNLFIFVLMLIFSRCSGMEPEKPIVIAPFTHFPNELMFEVLSWVVPASKNQDEAFTTFKSIQLANKQWFTCVHDSHLTEIVMGQIYKKFLPKLNFYALLNITRERKEMYQQSLHTVKTVAQNAVVHNNKLCTELQGKPWGKIGLLAYSHALRKSYSHIRTQLSQGDDFSKISQEISEEFQGLQRAQEPKEFLNQLQQGCSPHLHIASLLYFIENTDTLVKDILINSHYPFEKEIQFKAMKNNTFNNTTIWNPTYLRIEKLFIKRTEVKDKFIAQSKLMFT